MESEETQTIVLQSIASNLESLVALLLLLQKLDGGIPDLSLAAEGVRELAGILTEVYKGEKFNAKEVTGS